MEDMDRVAVDLSKDQIAFIQGLKRSLNKRRQGEGQRITDDTIVRTAIDLFVTKADNLQGTTEEELRAKLGLPDRD